MRKRISVASCPCLGGFTRRTPTQSCRKSDFPNQNSGMQFTSATPKGPNLTRHTGMNCDGSLFRLQVWSLRFSVTVVRLCLSPRLERGSGIRNSEVQNQPAVLYLVDEGSLPECSVGLCVCHTVFLHSLQLWNSSSAESRRSRLTGRHSVTEAEL